MEAELYFTKMELARGRLLKIFIREHTFLQFQFIKVQESKLTLALHFSAHTHARSQYLN
ncbi:hypothetical protein MXB_2575, partial [Myxobolus squamalis]